MPRRAHLRHGAATCCEDRYGGIVTRKPSGTGSAAAAIAASDVPLAADARERRLGRLERQHGQLGHVETIVGIMTATMTAA